MKVYAVIFDWSTSDDSSVEIELFDTYSKAFYHFMEIIDNEKKPDMSWVADAFDEKGNVLGNYEFDEHIESDGSQEFECWWHITDKYDWYRHDFLELRIMEVK